MKFDILTLFPEAFSVFFKTSIIGNAVKNGIISYECINFRDYSEDKHNRVDDYTYGGGKGMLIQPSPIYRAYNDIILKAGKRPKVIYMSPRGKVLNQEIACQLSNEDELVILCGHYEGVDQRVIDELCDFELSIGDYVLTGGEMPAMILCDCVSRLIPGVLSSDESFTEESHYNGLLEYDQYTRPEIYNGRSVPEVLLTGNKSNIDKWRSENAKKVTALNRPDLYIKNFKEEPFLAKDNYEITLIIIGSDEITKQEILLQLSKKNIICKNIIDESTLNNATCMQKTAVIICGEYPIYIDKLLSCIDMTNVLVQFLRPFSENRITKLLIPDFRSEYVPVKSFVTPCEFSEEVLRYCSALDDNNLINECVLSRVEFICSVPYDIYESHSELLKEFSSDKLFCINSSNVNFNGDGVILIFGKKYDIKVFSLRSRVYGKIQIAYIDGDITFYCQLFDNNSNGNFNCYLR
ncbi:MAG: tRNA (guanosine(37)-N1)-methyltransferase TrmD [Clostridia bacterium]|nr:tRNA (guanosine(37)-N1)-methyltransferase TrmD [Clostridia bacterium]